MQREQVAELLEDKIIGSQEVQDILLINRRRLSDLVAAGKISPIKEMKGFRLYWKPEIELLKQEMMKDTRTNLFKNK